MKNEYSNIHEYAEIIANAVNGTVIEVKKPNKDLTGIRLNNENRISPVYYVNEAFEKNIPVESVIDECQNFLTHYGKAPFDVDLLKKIENFDDVKDHIEARIVNRALNEHLRKNAPYHDVMGDLTVFYYIVIDNPESDGNYSIFVNNDILSLWNITEDELFKVAQDNAVLHAELKRMADVMPFFSGPELFTILTNDTAIYGAASILAVKELKNLQGAENVLLIPSSVHEWLILSNSDNAFGYDATSGLIQSVNSEALRPEDFLSDHPYRLSDIDF